MRLAATLVALSISVIAIGFGTGMTIASSPLNEPAEAATGKLGRETRLPVPRFVSLKTSKARMRIGPSTDYGTAFVYTARGLPMEITAEYDNWRQVRDCDGVSGWMHRSLLSGRRTAIVGPWVKKPIVIRSEPAATARAMARLAARVRLGVDRCDGSWCAVYVHGHSLSGFVRQSVLWGVYPGEKLG